MRAKDYIFIVSGSTTMEGLDQETRRQPKREMHVYNHDINPVVFLNY